MQGHKKQFGIGYYNYANYSYTPCLLYSGIYRGYIDCNTKSPPKPSLAKHGQVDPRTGEILKADIRMGSGGLALIYKVYIHNIVKYTLVYYSML